MKHIIEEYSEGAQSAVEFIGFLIIFAGIFFSGIFGKFVEAIVNSFC